MKTREVKKAHVPESVSTESAMRDLRSKLADVTERMARILRESPEGFEYTVHVGVTLTGRVAPSHEATAQALLSLAQLCRQLGPHALDGHERVISDHENGVTHRVKAHVRHDRRASR